MMGMKEICQALRPRKRDYQAQLVRAQRVIDNKDREILELRRKLANISMYIDKALA